jgi:hypothetical protein
MSALWNWFEQFVAYLGAMAGMGAICLAIMRLFA